MHSCVPYLDCLIARAGHDATTIRAVTTPPQKSSSSQLGNRFAGFSCLSVPYFQHTPRRSRQDLQTIWRIGAIHDPRTIRLYCVDQSARRDAPHLECSVVRTRYDTPPIRGKYNAVDVMLIGLAPVFKRVMRLPGFD